MAVRETMTKVIKVLDPAMRIPLVFAIDWFLGALDFSSLYTLSQSLPALVLLVLFLFIAVHGNLIFIYSFFISLYIAVVIAFFTIGKYIPSFQDTILNVNREMLVDALLLYQSLLIIDLVLAAINGWTVDNDWLVNNVQTFAILGTIAVLLCKINYGFMLGYVYFMASESFGVHKKLRQSFREASHLASNFGYLNTLIYYFRSKQITLVLRLFWLSAIITNFLLEGRAKFNIYWILISTAAATNTNLRLFGLALWIPEISYYILWISRAFLSWSVTHTAGDLEPRDLGKAVVFYFIASFNSILDVKIIQRVFFIALMLFISLSYILQSVFKLCDETLKALSTSFQKNYLAHIRAIALTISLVWVLFYSSWMFCSLFAFRVWQLVVVSSNVVTAVQALSSLACYALFVYDMRSLNKLEQLDDWVYYLNAVSNSLEFLSAFLVLSFAVWDVYQGSWSIFGFVVIVVHTYHNVWLRAKDGWKTFLGRRTAVTKLNRLSNATQEQLEALQDVCAICVESMSSAKITQCGHYFHSNCLRKWLYIQSRCPLCHQDVLINSTEDD